MQIQVTNALNATLTVEYSSTNVHIVNSYKVAPADIAGWVDRIRKVGQENGYTYPRTDKSWIREWKAHNVLYKFGIYPDRTKDVDLNNNEPPLRKLAYLLLSFMC